MIIRTETSGLLANEFDKMKTALEEDKADLATIPSVYFLCHFVPYIVEQLDSGNESELKKIFAFIEKLLVEGDEDVEDIVICSVIEAIYFDYDFARYKDMIFSLCGKLTRKSFEEVAVEII